MDATSANAGSGVPMGLAMSLEIANRVNDSLRVELLRLTAERDRLEKQLALEQEAYAAQAAQLKSLQVFVSMEGVR